MAPYLHCLEGVFKREFHRFLQQKTRLFSALVRPLLWLGVFAVGFRSALGVAIMPPYQSYITYEVYVTPGLVGLILLFNGMQSSLSMVYDREMGSMKVLLMSPLPRWYILLCKLLAGALVSALQACCFLAIAVLFEVRAPLAGYLWALPAMLLGGVALGALGLMLSSLLRQLENFAGLMNFVIFPMFFLSSALYPLWRMRESSEWLYHLCSLNPLTYVIELLRFALHGQLNLAALGVTAGAALAFTLAAALAYHPRRGLARRRHAGGGAP